jgi:hypothetical protein
MTEKNVITCRYLKWFYRKKMSVQANQISERLFKTRVLSKFQTGNKQTFQNMNAQISNKKMAQSINKGASE